MDDLALEVRELDLICIDDADRADACCRKVEGSRGSEATSTDDQDLGSAELLLALDADLLEVDVARLALELVRRKCHISSLRP